MRWFCSYIITYGHNNVAYGGITTGSYIRLLLSSTSLVSLCPCPTPPEAFANLHTGLRCTTKIITLHRKVCRMAVRPFSIQVVWCCLPSVSALRVSLDKGQWNPLALKACAIPRQVSFGLWQPVFSFCSCVSEWLECNWNWKRNSFAFLTQSMIFR